MAVPEPQDVKYTRTDVISRKITASAPNAAYIGGGPVTGYLENAVPHSVKNVHYAEENIVTGAGGSHQAPAPLPEVEANLRSVNVNIPQPPSAEEITNQYPTGPEPQRYSAPRPQQPQAYSAQLQQPQHPALPQPPQLPQYPPLPQYPQLPQQPQIPQQPQLPQYPQLPQQPQLPPQLQFPPQSQLPQPSQRSQLEHLQQRYQHLEQTEPPQQPQQPYQHLEQTELPQQPQQPSPLAHLRSQHHLQPIRLPTPSIYSSDPESETISQHSAEEIASHPVPATLTRGAYSAPVPAGIAYAAPAPTLPRFAYAQAELPASVVSFATPAAVTYSNFGVAAPPAYALPSAHFGAIRKSFVAPAPTVLHTETQVRYLKISLNPFFQLVGQY